MTDTHAHQPMTPAELGRLADPEASLSADERLRAAAEIHVLRQRLGAAVQHAGTGAADFDPYLQTR